MGGVPTRVTFGAAGTKAYVSNQSAQSVSIIDVAAGVQQALVPTVGDPVPLQVTADGTWLFVATNTNTLYRVDRATREAAGSMPLPATSHFMLLHPNDTLLYVATRDGGTVMEVNGRTMTNARTFSLSGRPQALALSPDGSELYVANERTNRVHVIDLRTGSAVASVPLEGGAFGLALGGNGTSLYASLLWDGKVAVIDRLTRQVVRTVVTGGLPRGVAVDAGTRLAIVANEAGWVDLLR